MTLEQAINHSKMTGDKIQHKFFLDYEFIIVDPHEHVITEQGEVLPLSEFLKAWEGNPYFKTDWSILKNI
jgi:hypothetical protein